MTTDTFSYTGAAQTFNWGSVTTADVVLKGAGGAGTGPGMQGAGGKVTGTLAKGGESSLQVNVGGYAGTFNGGGTAGTGNNGNGDQGADASDIRQGGTALANRVAVGAGGGGGGGDDGSGGRAGGVGGASTGGSGSNGGTANGGSGGTQLAGGAKGSGGGAGADGNDGSLGQGGNGPTGGLGAVGSGGGGGGFYGGGSGEASKTGSGAGGGGGSNYVGGLTSTTSVAGDNSGNGIITFTYTAVTSGSGTPTVPHPLVMGSSGTQQLTSTGSPTIPHPLVMSAAGATPYTGSGAATLPRLSASGRGTFTQHVADEVVRDGDIPAARFYLYDGNFNLIGQLPNVIAPARSFAIMEPGQASFITGMSEELAAECAVPNRVVVIRSTAYPWPWVGYITKVTWQPKDRSIQVQARSLDAILAERNLPVGFSVSGTAGACIAAVIEQANADNPTGIGHSAQLASGPARRFTLADRTAYAALNLIARRAGYEWWVEYTFRRNTFDATVQFAPARGVDRCRSYGLQWPRTCDWIEASLDNQATSYAMTFVGGQADASQGYSERARARAVAGSQFSKASSDVVAPVSSIHGHVLEHTATDNSPLSRRERLDLSEALKDQGDLDEATAIALMRPPRAERNVRIAALDDHTVVPWRELEVGNVIGLRIPDPDFYFGGYNGAVRIVGVQPAESDGECNLVVQMVGAHDE